MSDDKIRVSRRDILRGAGAAALVGATVPAQGAPAGKAPAGLSRVGPGPVECAFELNGKQKKITVEPRVTLLDALRDRVGLTGAKRICDRGACGGCTVWVDGQIVNSCMMLAVDARGKKVTTIEGLAQGDKLHPVQQAFVKHDALQCGFCTPGMIMTCAAMVDQGKAKDRASIQHELAGNLCRCGTYPHIFTAVEEAAR